MYAFSKWLTNIHAEREREKEQKPLTRSNIYKIPTTTTTKIKRKRKKVHFILQITLVYFFRVFFSVVFQEN